MLILQTQRVFIERLAASVVRDCCPRNNKPSSAEKPSIRSVSNQPPSLHETETPAADDSCLKKDQHQRKRPRMVTADATVDEYKEGGDGDDDVAAVHATIVGSHDVQCQETKALPSAAEGLRVLEFFSGIG